jgi:hypothetical protein
MSDFTINRLNKICENFGVSKYLEVGVNKGHTFSGVNCKNKEAVDPNFLFDYDQRQKAFENEKFFNVTSDVFFNKYASGSYDLIFLDGMHEFCQTLRDWCNAINYTHSGSIIIIDDTVPSDAYSSYPDQEMCIELRKNDTKLNKGAWHGDVYKVIFFIAHFFPSWSYATIMKGGNPQTILWQSKRTISTKFTNLLDIHLLNYFDLNSNLDFLNPIDDFDMVLSKINESRNFA